MKNGRGKPPETVTPREPQPPAQPALRATMLRDHATTTDCPPEETFVELIEGRLPGPAVARLQRHVEACDACQALVDALSEAETAPARPAAPGLTVGIARALQEASAMTGARGRGDAPDGPALGEIIGGSYRLVRIVGTGGMGSVYEAEHTETGERFAVKVINGRLLARGGEAPSRFRREARAAGALDSPHIVRVVDSGADDVTGDLYLIMDYLRGEDLQQLIDRVGPLRPDVALRITAQALVGLIEAHAAGIVHRDIKPANIFPARSGDGAVTVKLLDFGIAKIGPDPLSLPHTAGLTHTGGLLGSPLYMSPEQVQNSKDVDHRADLWSMGTTLYAALAGRAPHRDVASVGKLVLAICGSPAPPLSELAPWVRPEVAEVVHRALAIERTARYPSAAAMLDAVRALLPGGMALREEMLAGITPEERASRAASALSGPAAGAAKAAPRRARPIRRFAAGAALLLGIAVAGYGVERRRAPAPAAGVPVPREAPALGPAPVAATLSDAPEAMRRVLLVVFPEDASVEVDGTRVEVQGGAVELAGALGSEHRVRVFDGHDEIVARVAVTERGASPPKVELPPRRAVAAGGKPPISTGEAPKPSAQPAEGAPATSARRKPREPSVEELLRQPE